MKTEKEYNKELTKPQKGYVKALKELGFKWKYFNTYELMGWGEMNVAGIVSLPHLLRLVHEQGKDQKRYEFQRVLGI